MTTGPKRRRSADGEDLPQEWYPTVYRFTTATCPNCKTIAPLVETAAHNFADTVQLVDIDAEADSEEVQRYAVRAVPTLIAVRDREVVTRLTGTASSAEIERIFAAAAGVGPKRIRTISAQDRIVRTGAGIVLGAIGLVTGMWWLAVVGGLFIAGGWWDLLRSSGTAGRPADHDEIEVDDLYRIMQSRQPPVILDVRSERERSSGHVPESLHADINSATFSALIERLPRADHYVAYCASGKRSAVAVRTMRQLGFSHVQHLRGGYQRWKAGGFPTG